jgi:uncharacterized SAM-binding protein YcdF (DUF218 family)
MSAFFSTLFTVSGVVVSVLVAALWCAARPRSAAARRFLLGVALAYTIASIYIVPYSVGRLLSSGYHRFDQADAPSGTNAVVILGAGDWVVQGWDERIFPLNIEAASRVLEAWRVYKLISPKWMISSGGSVGRGEASSTNMREALVRLGVPSSRILLESDSYSTHDEAIFVTRMLRTLHVDKVVLVTGDIHMRRSVGAFRAQGIDAIPAMAPDSRGLYPWRGRMLPTAAGLELSRKVVHELLGIPYYWARGWWKS